MHTLKILTALIPLAGFGAVLTLTQPAAAQDRARYYALVQLDIPPDHYPPPGECRLWFIDRSPQYQPPSTACVLLQDREVRRAVVLYDGGVYDPNYHYEDIKAVPRAVRPILDLLDIDVAGNDDTAWAEGGDAENRQPGIPADQYPPPGECRLWHIGVPLDRQPPAVPCKEIGKEPFEDAVLLYDNRVWDPYGDYDWDRVPNVIRRLIL